MGFMLQATVVIGILFFIVVTIIQVITSTRATRNINQTAKNYRLLSNRVATMADSITTLNEVLVNIIRFAETAPTNKSWQEHTEASDENWSMPMDKRALPLEEKVPGER